MGAWFRQIGQNVEMPTFTQAVYDARELAVARMQAEAQREGAEGIVSVKIDEHTHEGDSHIIEYFAQGPPSSPPARTTASPPRQWSFPSPIPLRRR
jgi:uncharacterized protein YbjQ (UPF0145 family)